MPHGTGQVNRCSPCIGGPQDRIVSTPQNRMFGASAAGGTSSAGAVTGHVRAGRFPPDDGIEQVFYS